MRIGMFADMYLPHVSGVTNHIRLYRAELERQGHEVLVFTWGDRGYRDDEPGVFRSPSVPWGDTGWNWPLGISREASLAMRTLDVAHAHHPFASCLIALRLQSRSSIPVVFTNHTRYDLYSDTYVAWIPHAIRHGAIRRYLMWLNRRVSLTISPSADVAEWLAGYGALPEKLLVFHNAIDTRAFANPSAPRTKAELGLAEDAFALAYVGRIAHEKNVALLLDAFTRAAASDPRLALVLVGDGPARQLCERSAAEAGVGSRVRFLGMTPYEEVPGVLAACDAFVTASVSEMYPLVVAVHGGVRLGL
jgi:1,2-diacylglycerol 3-alpha-glucosyltransferase